MIEAKPALPVEALAARLEERAATLAAAVTEEAALARRQDQSRWRRADLVWPLFQKG